MLNLVLILDATRAKGGGHDGFARVGALCDAAPMWDAWPFLIMPLLVGIAVAYKATKSATPAAAALDAAKLSGYLLLGLSPRPSGFTSSSMP